MTTTPAKIYAVDQTADYELRWACEPPAMGARYRVLRDEWSEDYAVRTIFEWVAP